MAGLVETFEGEIWHGHLCGLLGQSSVESREVYLGDGLGMAGCSARTLGRDSAWSLLRYPEKQSFLCHAVILQDITLKCPHCWSNRGEETIQSLLRSPRTEFSKFEELYLGNCLDIADYLVVTYKGETAHSLLRSPWDTDILKSVQVYLVDGLEISGHLVTLRKG